MVERSPQILASEENATTTTTTTTTTCRGRSCSLASVSVLDLVDSVLPVCLGTPGLLNWGYVCGMVMIILSLIAKCLVVRLPDRVTIFRDWSYQALV